VQAKRWGRWQEPIGPHYVFLALDLDSDAAVKRSPVRKLLERVTGMPTVIGTDITEPPLQDSIIRTITGAQLVVADITDLRDGEHDPKRFNLDVCIEAAISYQAGTNPSSLPRVINAARRSCCASTRCQPIRTASSYSP